MRNHILTLGVLLLTAIAVLPGSAALAQQPASQQAQNDTQDDGTADDDVTAADNAQSNEQADTGLPDIDNQPIQPGSAGPGRFIPSEQISQDLGVSFPVDI